MVSQGRPMGAAARGVAAMIAASALTGLAACGSAAGGGTGQPAAAGATHSREPAAAASASAGVPLCTAARTVDQVVASSMTAGDVGQILPRAITIRDAPRVRALAAALCALPPRPARLHCPVDLGGAVRLVFTAGGRGFVPVRIQGIGCSSVTGIGPPRLWWWSSRPGLLLRKAIGKGPLVPHLRPTSVPPL